MKTPLVEAFFDGAVEPVNPGGSGSFGIVISIDNHLVHQDGRYIGSGPEISNNVAEYCGVVAVLRWLLDNQVQGNVIIRGDSDLAIRQLRGSWKARAGLYLPYYHEAKLLLDELKARPNVTVRLEWVPREYNSLADEISKQVLADHGVLLTERP